MQKRVLVTGIGGVVGQGILRNIRSMERDIEIIGVNITKVSAGNYLCDRVYEGPYAYDNDYIPTMRQIVTNESIGLVIPSTDYESYYLGEARDSFPCYVACSPANITKFCLDKYLNFKEFKQHDIPFASSFLPSEYNQEFEKIVVKPREGRGSRNIYINPPNPTSFDDSYLIQAYLEGPEITTTVYVNSAGDVHGMITFVRELEQGNTAKCEVVFEYDDELAALVKKILNHYKFSGSFNIQSRVTSNGIIPFEINCRISGTNSVRSQFGFNDVAYTVQEYLLNEKLVVPRITKGSALRVILDIIYPGMQLSDIKNCSDQFYIH
jgi:carbamoyl-phosphate synthase large subunit